MTDFHRIHQAPPPERAVHSRVRTRDRLHLATDAYLVDDAPRPVVLTRSPYDIASDFGHLPAVGDYFNAAGYHFVAQDVRGKFRSDGETLIFVNEANDGYDTIEWITQQPWSNGEVVMWGDSYYGYTQWAAASAKHPALKAISPRITGTGLGQHPDCSRSGNTRDVFQSVLVWYTTSFYMDRFGVEWQPRFGERPYLREFVQFQRELGEASPSFSLYLPTHVPARRFPEGHPFDRPAIPTLITTGWWDNCALWVWRDYWDLQQRPDWRNQVHLVIDPVDHNYNYFGEAPTWGAARAAVIDGFLPRYLDPSIEFFDRYLGRAGASREIPRVRWTLVGEPGYQEADQWPPASAKDLVWYPGPGGSLVDAAPESARLEWLHDPDDPIPAPVVDPFNFLGEEPREQPHDDRVDLLAFTSAPFATATDLVGRVFFTAPVGSTGPRMDLILRLYDQAPNGDLQRISGGQVHIIDAGAEAEVSIEMDPVGYRIPEGHSLRLHVASSEFPTYIPQPGTPEPEWEAVRTERTTQSLWVGAGTALTIGAPRE